MKWSTTPSPPSLALSSDIGALSVFSGGAIEPYGTQVSHSFLSLIFPLFSTLVKEALKPLTSEFPHLYNKHDVALPLELKPYAKRASIMAAIDYIVCKESDVFMASHGGNMGHTIQGHRAYEGHKKLITPNKRHMLPYFLNNSMTETEFEKMIKKLHMQSLGQPELRISKAGRDITKYLVPEGMCNNQSTPTI